MEFSGGEGMARPREPIDLIKAKGKTHLTRAEYEERKEQELEVPFLDVKPPEYLTGEKQLEKFNYYAEMLLKLGIFTELDVDCLARYIMGEQLYLQYTNLLVKLIKSKDYDQLTKIQSLQDRAFKQCQQCARDLGLTISSRCKLIVPQTDGDEDFEL
jgi:P27 family predicted phage terminase small subunit